MRAGTLLVSGSILVLVLVLSACGGTEGAVGPGDMPTPGTLDFDRDSLTLGLARSAVIDLFNGTSQTLGPITFGTGGVFDASGVDVRGVTLSAIPPTIPPMEPGQGRSVSIDLNDRGLPPGEYGVVVEARIEGTARATIKLAIEVPPGRRSSAVVVRIMDAPQAVRQGDPVVFTAEARNDRNELLPPEFVEWFVLPTDAGLLNQTGRFVPYDPGAPRIIARSGTVFDTVSVEVMPRNASGTLQLLGRGSAGRGAESVWAIDGFVFVGTGPAGGTSGNALEIWAVADPSAPTLVAEVELDTERIPAVHVRADGALAAVAHSGSSDGLNGVTLLDVTDPASPSVIARFTDGLEEGVRDVWLDRDHLYVAEGGAIGTLHIIDVSDPSIPAEVAQYWTGSSFVSDVTVTDGYAMVSHFNSGVISLDVGNGLLGGSPEAPVEAGRILPSGQSSTSAYWSAAGWVFVTEDDATLPGPVHVVNAADLTQMFESGTWAVDGGPPRHVTVDPGGSLAFAAWGAQGVRMLDASGSLEGKLDRQAREVAELVYDGASTNAVELHFSDGVLYVADAAGGLVILQPGG